MVMMSIWMKWMTIMTYLSTKIYCHYGSWASFSKSLFMFSGLTAFRFASGSQTIAKLLVISLASMKAVSNAEWNILAFYICS